MKTFTGQYTNNTFIYSDDLESLRVQLLSILNTPIGSRYYYPDYGSTINSFRFAPLTYFTINAMAAEIKRVIGLIDGITLSDLSYSIDGNSITFSIGLKRLSENLKVNVTISDGLAT